jgi:glutamyl/glutaminyl-tRNA synthetase
MAMNRSEMPCSRIPRRHLPGKSYTPWWHQGGQDPNGHLHIGHAKAMAINFGFAQYYGGGDCCLRLDDMNPDTASDVYNKSIKDTLSWLGFEPARITFSSDYFDRLYDLAEFLISEDGAYVCRCSRKSTRNFDARKRLTIARK